MLTNQLFAQRLKLLREEHNLSVSELARQLDTSKSMISRYESAMNLPIIEVLIKIADYFKVSTDYLLGRTDNDCKSLSVKTKCPNCGANIGSKRGLQLKKIRLKRRCVVLQSPPCKLLCNDKKVVEFFRLFKDMQTNTHS